MTRKLTIGADGFSLPLKAATEKFAFLGRTTGAGLTLSEYVRRVVIPRAAVPGESSTGATA